MSKFSRFLCWFLSVLMLVTPNAWVMAQEDDEDTAISISTEPVVIPSPDFINTPNEKGWPRDTTLLADPAIVPVPDVIDKPLDITYLLPQACVVVSARPQAIMTSPLLKMMPIEVIQAASIQQTGIDALLMDRLLVSMEPPVAGPPNYAAMASFTAPVADKLHPQVTAELEKQTESKRLHFKNTKPLEPSLYFPSDDVLLATPEATLQKFLLGGAKPTDGELHKRLQAAANDDLYVGVNFVPLRPLVNMAMMQAQIPPQLGHFYLAPDLIKLIELRLNLTHPEVSELVVEANNDDDAEKLEQIVLKSVDLIKAEAAKEAARLKADPDPVQQAMGRYQERIMNEMASAYLPKRDGEKLVIFRLTGDDAQTNALTMTAVSGILVALLLPAVQAAREAARRTTSINNVKNIMLGLLNHESARKSLPAHAIYSTDGKPLLSWRVRILQYLPQDQPELYKQFHLDEPWDSEHNKQLISKMPAVFLDPSSRLQATDGRTHYLGVKGDGMFFNGTDKGTDIRMIRDGTSQTIAVVQVNDERATTWTKPDDWELDPKTPLKGLTGSMHPGTFVAGYADGSVRNISEGIDPTVFKGMLTIAGGEDIPAP